MKDKDDNKSICKHGKHYWDSKIRKWRCCVCDIIQPKLIGEYAP